MAIPIVGILGALVKPVSDLISEFVEDPDKKKELETKVALTLMSHQHEIEKAAADNVKAEIQGESWMQRNWRPSFMFVAMFVIVWDQIVMPIAAYWGYPIPAVGVPEQMWDLLTIGLGGYVIGRSGEKVMREYKKK